MDLEGQSFGKVGKDFSEAEWRKDEAFGEEDSLFFKRGKDKE